jgi:hypothetical protein
MSYERDNIDNFWPEFDKFSRSWDKWIDSSNPNFSYLRQFNTKLRMAFGISEIILDGDIDPDNVEFLSRKEGPMKELHKFQYKLMDLWFAYETFFKFYQKIKGSSINSTIVWLDNYATYSMFNSEIITNAINTANNEMNQSFNNQTNKIKLKKYIQHCENHSKKSQKSRLNAIVSNFGENLKIKDILTITYAIRNNYVHNGETTITNAGLDNLNFSFDETQKLKLVKICYNFLAIFTVNIANTLIEQHN